MIARLWTLGLTIWFVGVAQAHDFGIANVSLVESSPGKFLLEAKSRSVDEPSAPNFPQGFTVSAKSSRNEQGARIQQWTAVRSKTLTTEESIVLPWAIGGAYVTAEWSDGIDASHFFKSGNQGATIEVSRIGGKSGSIVNTIWTYIQLGFEHILAGWDHLAFVIAIFLISRGKRLVRLITGFTIGHSFTLIAAALGWIHLPSPPVEAAIALSIVLVAVQSLSRTDSSQHGFWLVFSFGLLHGLGFAGALGEIGIPRRELLLALLSFNIGVELGQLTFVAAIVSIAAMGRKLAKSTSRPVLVWSRVASACSLIVIGSFWTLERVLSFGG